MKNKIIRNTFWGGAGVALASLIGSLSLVALAPGTTASTLTPPPRKC